MASRRSSQPDVPGSGPRSAGSGSEASGPTQWHADRREDAGDERDRAADERDAAAQAREAVAGARDVLADAREAQLAQWEHQLAEQARRLGLSFDVPTLSDALDSERQARAEAAELRDEAARIREAADAARADMAQRRAAERRASLLAAAFAGIAEHLFESESYDELLARVAQAAVTTVAGSTMASVTMAGDVGVRTAAAAHRSARTADPAGQTADEATTGVPSITGHDGAAVPGGDQPTRSSAGEPADGSSLSFHLTTSGDPAGRAASLTIYAADPDAFDEAARDIGFILAAHASLAARAVGERVSLEGLGSRMEQALLSRDVIGQAKGILMERLKTTPDNAFEILRRSSQRLNVKLREVARQLTETGEVSGSDLVEP